MRDVGKANNLKERFLIELGLIPTLFDDKIEYENLITEGVDGRVLEIMCVHYGFKKLFIEVFGVLPFTISRFYSRKHLSLLQSECLLEVVKVFLRATEVFESTEKTQKWFDMEIVVLEEKSPMDRCLTSIGRNEILVLLKKIESGEFT